MDDAIGNDLATRDLNIGIMRIILRKIHARESGRNRGDNRACGSFETLGKIVIEERTMATL